MFFCQRKYNVLFILINCIHKSNYPDTVRNEVSYTNSHLHGYHTLADESSHLLTPFIQIQSVPGGTVPLNTHPSPLSDTTTERLS